MSDAAQASPRRRQVPCPACGQPSEYSADNPFRPFCSERCKNTDFGAWASERYRVAAPPPNADDENGESPEQSPH